MKRLIMAIAVMFAVTGVNAQKINFIPLPQSVQYEKGSFFLVDKNVVIRGGNEFNASYLQSHMENAFDFKVERDAGRNKRQNLEDICFISFETDPSLGQEAYTIDVTMDGIKVVSGARPGEFYAIQTILQMMPASVYKPVPNHAYGDLVKEWFIPCMKIVDSPRFAYRGNMFDVSRSFFDKEYIIRHLEFLAYHKINKFHWHLTDDNGWRVEIKKYPKLTSVGAWRGKNEALEPAYNSGADSYGGFYTQDDIREIVAFAADRNIEIIPEIDLPGHSKSAAVSYPEIVCNTEEELLSVQGETKNVFCAGNEGTYKMLDGILKELAKLFPSQYINIGGDEVVMENWKNCPECQAVMKKMGYTSEKQLMQYFVERMEKIAAKYGKKIGGWEDIAVSDKISRDALVVVWHGKKVAQRVLDSGFPIVLQDCNNLYFDMKQSRKERGHTWAAIISPKTVYEFDPYANLELTEEAKSRIIGLQGGLWTEMLFFPPHFAEYQLFPRMCAAAEIGWTAQEKRCYEDFDARLSGSHFERMANMGIRFRLPYPEVKAEKVGKLWSIEAPAPYANTVVRYTTNRADPTVSSPVLNGKLLVKDAQNLRFATFFGDNSSKAVDIPESHTYLKPATKVTTSMKPARGYSIDDLALYDDSKYFRSSVAPKAGDYVLFEFDEPISVNIISVRTNDPVNEFWGITEGHVEALVEGYGYVTAGYFSTLNKVEFSALNQKVKAVKIVCDGPNEGKSIAIRHLDIE